MDELRSILTAQFAGYPAMAPQDGVKLIYQNEFGGGHLITDEEGALVRLSKEHRALTHVPDMGYREDIGNGLCRIQLAAVDKREIPLSTLNRLFLLGAEQIRGDTIAFQKKLEVLRAVCREGGAPFSLTALDNYLKEYTAAGCPAVSHSQAYREAYKPAYRVLPCRTAAYWKLFSAIHRLLEEKSTVTVAIDGMAAAGKTTLAALLEAVYSCTVIHMDDFFLPRELRTPERLAQPGGNVHFERFAAEVSPYLGRFVPFSYKPFDCGVMDYGPAVTIQPHRLTVVEGSYSHHPGLGAAYDLKVFLTILQEEQYARILTRNGPKLSRRFREEWIPMENTYSAAFHIRKHSDLEF